MKIVLFLISFHGFCYMYAADDDFNPIWFVQNDDILKALFPPTCAKGEKWINETSSRKKVQCVIHKGHFAEELAQFCNDAEAMGCKLDVRMAKYMADNFASDDYLANPIYQRMGADCGFCGHKPACCGIKNAEDVSAKMIKKHPDLKNMLNAFYFQSLKGDPCSDKSKNACSFKPLTPAEFDKLATLQPFTKNVDRSDDCNFAQFGLSEWEESRHVPSFPLVEPLFNKFSCSTVKTNRPRVNCVKNADTKQCMCCCNNSYPEKNGGNWVCVEKNEQKSEKICSSM